MFDQTDVVKNFIRSINFQKRTPEAAEVQTVDENTDDTDPTTTETTYTLEKLDSIKSCESVLKIFGFEPGNFDKNNEKCLRFWSTINERADLKPVDCLIMDAHNNKKNCECQTEQEESESSMWARALYELRKRKLDKLAMVSSLPACKFCEAIPKYPVTGYSKEDLQDNQDLTVLNDWNPVLKTRGSVNAMTEMNRSRLFRDKSIDVQGSTSLLGSKSVPTVDAKDKVEISETVNDIEEDKQGKHEEHVDDVDNEAAGTQAIAIKVIEDMENVNEEEEITPEVIDDNSVEDVDNDDDQVAKTEEIPAEVIEAEQQQNEPITDEEKQEVMSLLKEIFNNVFANQAKSDQQLTNDCRDNCSEVQNIVSLLELQPGQYHTLDGNTASFDKIKLRSSMTKETYQGGDQKKQLTFHDDISYVEEEISATLLDCPCTMELKGLTSSKCVCQGDVCRKGGIKDVVVMKKLIAKQLAQSTNSYSKRMCIDRIFEKIKDGGLTSSETAAYVQQIMDSCACPSSSCECIIHHIDLPESKDTVDAVFIKAMLMEKFKVALKAAQVRERSLKKGKKQRVSIGSQCESEDGNLSNEM